MKEITLIRHSHDDYVTNNNADDPKVEYPVGYDFKNYGSESVLGRIVYGEIGIRIDDQLLDVDPVFLLLGNCFILLLLF